jgi:hypothetical protein
MPRVLWALHNDCPSVQVQLTFTTGGQQLTLVLLADTGAGKLTTPFELLLRDGDCRLCGGVSLGTVNLGRAYRGPHPVYRVRVQIPALGFDQHVLVVGISSPPAGFGGTACFRFLSRFHYGNFGYTDFFGLESLSTPRTSGA